MNLLSNLFQSLTYASQAKIQLDQWFVTKKVKNVSCSSHAKPAMLSWAV